MIRRSRTAAISSASMLALCIACVSAPPHAYEPQAYENARPEWVAFPALGASVSETLRGLFDEGEENFRLSLREIAIFRTDASTWEEIPLEDLPHPADLASGSYAIATRRFCRAWADQTVLVSANEWFLFRDGRLAAYDSRRYYAGCGYAPVLEPARAGMIESEARLRSWVDENLAAADEPKLVHYLKGIVYADAGRLDVAEQCLASGDSAALAASRVPVMTRTLGRFAAVENLPRDLDDVSARKILVAEIERLRRRPGIPE